MLGKIFGSRNKRVLRRLQKTVYKINSFEKTFSELSDDSLKAKTGEFKSRLETGESIDKLLPEAFAVVREASMRVLKMRHFDVQLIGGMVLHENCIAEMRTGEGKTLMATLAAYLNALPGKGVHVVTANDYLAARDAKWMEPVYNFLGLSVGVIISDLTPEQRQESYQSDITYGTNNEFGFDYLRDNMAHSPDQRVQRGLHYAIADEVDLILIDEARTPLIISGPADDHSDLYVKIDKLVPQLDQQLEKDGPGDYSLDEKSKQVHLTESGHQHVEEILMEAGLLDEGSGLYHVKNINLMHHVNAALRANTLFQKDIDYIIENNEVVIIDEHTGRKMQGRRWSDGLHQAVEAKEGVDIQTENQTMASITFQNYFRLYTKLAGMTGTADTEAYEFQQIYGLEVVVIPTNKPMVRKDQPDLVYMTQDDKFEAISKDIAKCVENKQPVLVGTASIETSEILSNLLNKQKITHQVLNAKFHEKEAHIIAQAGLPGNVTIATNMAGRGTDIVLGGNLEAEIKDLGDKISEAEIEKRTQDWTLRHRQVLDAGGLRIIGTERHESRRIDNQLRGRAGRQGDNGSSRFYLSLEDNLLRIFAADRLKGIMSRVGMKKGDSLESVLLTRCIENAQRKVESHNFDIRKQLLEYDDVANDQRKIVYHQRNQLMDIEDISENITGLRTSVISETVDKYIPPQSMPEQWDVDTLEQLLRSDFSYPEGFSAWLDANDRIETDDIKVYLTDQLANLYQEKEDELTAPVLRQFEKSVMLHHMDTHWREHLAAMDYLRQGIHLRGYAQKNPKQEYKRESFNLFSEMLSSIKYEVLTVLSSFRVQSEEAAEEARALEQQLQNSPKAMQYHHDEAESIINNPQGNDVDAHDLSGNGDESQQPYTREEQKVGRNEPCPCGSGKKYKQCHGKVG